MRSQSTQAAATWISASTNTTYENSQISAVDMHHENLDGDTVVPYDLIKGQQVHYQN